MGNNASLGVDLSDGTPSPISDGRKAFDSSGLTSRPFQHAAPSNKLSKPRVGKILDTPAAGLLPSIGTQRKQREAHQRLSGMSWPWLSRRANLRPAPVDIPVSAAVPEDTVDPAHPWSDLVLEDFIPPPPPPPDPDDSPDGRQPRRMSLFRSLSVRDQADGRGTTGGFMRSRSKSRTRNASGKGGDRAYSMTAAVESFAGEGYVPQVIENTRYAMSKRNAALVSPSVADSPSWAAQRRLGHIESPIQDLDLVSPTENTPQSQSSRSRAHSDPRSRCNSMVRIPSSNTTLMPRADSDASLFVPIRRRSMIQTPGVATRAPRATQPGARYSMPPTPTSVSRRTSFDYCPAPGPMTSSPPQPPPVAIGIQRISRIDGVGSGDVVRVLTPCEDDYRQLGGIKFGSLRIVNGSPVRGPDVENEKEPWDAAAVVATKQQYQPHAQVGGELEADIEDDSEDMLMMKAPLRPGSPSPGPIPRSIIGEALTASPGSMLGHVASLDLDVGDKCTEARDRTEFLANMAFSPFDLSVSRMPSVVRPRLQVTTTRRNAHDAARFGDEASPGSPATNAAFPNLHAGVQTTTEAASTLEYSPVEVLSIRQDPSAKPQRRPRPEPVQLGSAAVSRSDSGIVASPTTPSPSSEVALSKADSGYSSNSSVRSMWSSRGSSVATRWRSNPGTAAEEKSKRERSAMTTSRPAGDEQDEEEKIKGLAQQDGADVSSPTSARSSWSPHRAWLSVKRRSSSHSHRKPGSTDGSPSATKTGPCRNDAPVVVPADALNGFPSSLESPSQRPRKLKRLLSGARPPTRHPSMPPTPTPPIHKLEPGPPDVPYVDLADDMFPGEPECESSARSRIVYDRFALRGQHSKATLQTIFSVGSLEFNNTDGFDLQGRKSLQSLMLTNSAGGHVPGSRIKTGSDSKFLLSLSPLPMTPTTPTTTTTAPTDGATGFASSLTSFHGGDSDDSYFSSLPGLALTVDSPSAGFLSPLKPSAAGLRWSAPPLPHTSVQWDAPTTKPSKPVPVALETQPLSNEHGQILTSAHPTLGRQRRQENFSRLPSRQPAPRGSPQHSTSPTETIESPAPSFQSPPNFQVTSRSHLGGTPRLPPAMPDMTSQAALVARDANASVRNHQHTRRRSASLSSSIQLPGRTVRSYNSSPYRNAPIMGYERRAVPLSHA